MWRQASFSARLFRSSLRGGLLVSGLVLLFLFPAMIAFSQDSGSSDTQQQTAPPPPPSDLTIPAEQASGPESNVRAVRISDVEGVVKVYQGDQLVFDQAQPNMPAVEGMRFDTSDNGRMEIELEDGSVARVTPNSSIRLSQLHRDSSGTTITQIDALKGLTYYELNGHGGKVSVHFDTEVATPIESAVFRISLDAAPNTLAAMHGAVHVEDGQGVALDVHPNQTFQTDPQQPGEFTVAQSLTADSWDQWNSDRDDALASLEANQTTARASVANPNDAAWNDLDYYGDWYDLPGYGEVWAPAGVDENWDPFGNGSWDYYSGLGYTWISGYPWGWWPYHCGAWDFVGGWGWIWIPGNCGFSLTGGCGWYPYATVWRMPRGYVPPFRPHPHPHPGPHPRPIPVIAVNRGPQYSAPFHKAGVPRPEPGGGRPEPRVLAFDGRQIAPLQAGIHPLQRGPVGENFTTSLVREHPEMTPRVEHSPGFVSPVRPETGVRSFGPQPGMPRISPGLGVTPGGTFHGYAAPAGSAHPPASGSAVHVGGGGASAGGGGHPSGGGGGGGGGSHPSGGGGSPHH